MKLPIFMFALFALSACNIFGGADPAPNPAPGHQAGTFHAGPYTDPESGKSCSAPGGYCDDDKQCHSDASKCLKQ